MTGLQNNHLIKVQGSINPRKRKHNRVRTGCFTCRKRKKSVTNDNPIALLVSEINLNVSILQKKMKKYPVISYLNNKNITNL